MGAPPLARGRIASGQRPAVHPRRRTPGTDVLPWLIVGVIMSYVWRQGRFWLTASGQRARISAVQRDPRVCIVVTSTGSPLPRNKTVTWKGTCVVHESREVKSWFYPELAAALHGTDPVRRDAFVAFLDSPRRVVLEVIPVQRIGYDGAKMTTAATTWMGTDEQQG